MRSLSRCLKCAVLAVGQVAFLLSAGRALLVQGPDSLLFSTSLGLAFICTALVLRQCNPIAGTVNSQAVNESTRSSLPHEETQVS